MGKIIKIFNKAAMWLASWGTDKYLHLIAGLLIAYIVGEIADGVWWSAALVGVLIATIVGFIKEIIDGWTSQSANLGDLMFTIIGGFMGMGLIGLHVWLR